MLSLPSAANENRIRSKINLILAQENGFQTKEEQPDRTADTDWNTEMTRFFFSFKTTFFSVFRNDNKAALSTDRHRGPGGFLFVS